MKILQVNKFFYRKGGSEAYLFSLIDGLKEAGHSVAEFAMRDSMNQPSDWDEYFVSTVDYDTPNVFRRALFAGRIIYSLEARRNIGRLLDRFRPDIVHLHIFQHQLSASILPEIKKRKIPIVYTAHDLKIACPNYKMFSHGRVCEECKGAQYYHCFTRKCVKNSGMKSMVNVFEMYFHRWKNYYDLIDIIITPSRFYREKLIEFGLAENKIIHIPNFVDEKKFLPTYSHRGYFIFFGRLSEEKGLLSLLQAMKSVPDGRLIIIGTGPLVDSIRDKIDSFHLSNVSLAGFQSGESLRHYIADAMFTVIPSEWYENGPLSLLESFAYGKPVIGADMGGIPEYISHGRDGLIFKNRNPADLADAINYLLYDECNTAVMGRNARRKIEERFYKKEHLSRIVSVYDRLVYG